MLPPSSRNCPMESILRLLMGPWTAYILWFLHLKGEMRFGEIKRQLNGVSSKILTERLRMLEDAGIIYRRYEPTVPPKVTYGLDNRGKQLSPILESLNKLGAVWTLEDQETKVV